MGIHIQNKRSCFPNLYDHSTVKLNEYLTAKINEKSDSLKNSVP